MVQSVIITRSLDYNIYIGFFIPRTPNTNMALYRNTTDKVYDIYTHTHTHIAYIYISLTKNCLEVLGLTLCYDKHGYTAMGEL